MRAWVVSLLVLTLFAGCADAPAEGGSETFSDGQEIVFGEAATSDTEGGISGVVVDTTITPVEGIGVALVGLGKATTTDANGIFVFDALEPGTYFLKVNGTGYLETQSSVEVRAGEVTRAKIVVDLDPAPQPYHDTIGFNWFDSAGVTLVDFLIDLTDDTFLGNSLPDACDNCQFFFETAGPVETFVVEAVWTDNVAKPGESTSFFWTLADGEAWTNGYEDGYFTSPGVAHIGENRWGETTFMQIKMTGDETWITADQSAEIFITMFYNGPAPEGWSFVAGDP